MSLSRVIEVSFGGGSIAYAKVDTAYFYNNGIIFKPTDIDLPASYQVHWADSPQATTTLETIGTAEGAPIPDDLWNRSRVIYGWIYLHPTEDSGITAYEVRIYKNVRAGLPDGTEPTPAEQSTIDQLIGALNSAVEQTGEDVESASQSAQSAESAKTAAESARDTAGEYANDAESSAASASTSASQASTSATASAQSASQSAQIKADVEDLVDDAQSYAESALIASQASVTARDTAQGYAQSASASAQSASGYASSAQTSAQTASTKATEASTSAQTASQKATEASQSASQALSYKTDAESAKTASQTAQGKAEDAQTAAETAQGLAESARDSAIQAKDDAESAVASISGALADKAPIITDTASGSIASFPDGADDLPLKSLVVDINPVQDLHGQDAPYPAGGGKNILPYAVIESPLTKNGITFVKSQDGSIAVNGTSTRAFAQTFVNFALQPGNYYFNCGNGFSMQSNISLYIRDLDNSRTLAEINTYNVGTDRPFSIDVQTNVRFYMVFGQTDLVISSTLYPMVRLASETDATYAPYENICPISGWTEVQANQSGVNVLPFPYAAETTTRFGITYTVHDDGTITVNGTATHDSWFELANTWQYGAKVLDVKTIYVSGCPSGGSDSTYKLVCVPTGHKDIGNGFTISDFKARWFRFQIQVKNGTTVNNLVFKPMVVLGSTATPYEPYTGRSITINLGQTVYGGRLDVLSGVMTVDMAMVDLGTLDWLYYVGDSYAMFFTPAINDIKKSAGWRGICSIYGMSSVSIQNIADKMISNGYGDGRIRVKDSRFTDVNSFVADVSGQTLVYELAEPIEIQLSPNQINSLYGVNNIWADSGDTTAEYRADTKLFIERLTAPDSADMIADANIQSGQYFMVGNNLYKATANIANGASIIVGTNAVRKSLSEALNEINA